MSYTLKQAADLLGITKNQVKYRVKKLPPEEISTSPEGVLLLSEAGYSMLKSQVLSGSEKPPSTDFNQSSTTFNQFSTGSNQSKTGSTDSINHPENHQATTQEPAPEVETLRLALAILERQLEAKDRQIEQLTQALNTATQATAAAQALHAGEIQRSLNAAKPEEPEKEPAPEQKKPPRSWWKWWKQQ